MTWTLTPKRWLFIISASLLAVALMFVVGLCYSVTIVRAPGYTESRSDFWTELLDSGFTLRNKPCDVLVYGDSTASVGVDPRVISSATGLRSCNISTLRPIVDDLGTWPLDTFLDHNPKPRFLVLAFGPELFYRLDSGWKHDQSFPPLMMLARNAPMVRAVGIMVLHPSASFQFEFATLRDRFLPRTAEWIAMRPKYRSEMQVFRDSGGMFDWESMGTPRQKACDYPALPLYAPLDAAWIRQLRRKYQVQGITVLVMASPIPDCDPQLRQFKRELDPLLDAPLTPLPVSDFLIEGRHPTLAGAQEVSRRIAALIGCRMSEEPDPAAHQSAHSCESSEGAKP